MSNWYDVFLTMRCSKEPLPCNKVVIIRVSWSNTRDGNPGSPGAAISRFGSYMARWSSTRSSMRKRAPCFGRSPLPIEWPGRKL